MAECLRGEMYLPDEETIIMPDYWNISHPIYPKGNNIRTDVMLLQIMLKVYFMSRSAGYEAAGKAFAILNSSKTRFDDGIYGANTRAVLDIYEVRTKAPYRDGIVRPVPPRFQYTSQYTKLNRLNNVWNSTMATSSVGTDKKEQARILFHPLLFREMYGA